MGSCDFVVYLQKKEMKFLITIGAMVLLMSFSLSAQEKTYSITAESRNKAIDLINKANVKIKERHPEEAFSLLVKATEIDSTILDAYGLMYDAAMYSKSSSNEVITLLQKGKRIYPDDDELSFYLADIYRISEKLPKAIAEYSITIRLSKSQTTTPKLIHSYYFNRGTCYLKVKNYDAAILDYAECLKRDPENSFTNLNMGNCYYNKKQIAKARIYWQKSAEMGNGAAKEYLSKSAKMVH